MLLISTRYYAIEGGGGSGGRIRVTTTTSGGDSGDGLSSWLWWWRQQQEQNQQGLSTTTFLTKKQKQDLNNNFFISSWSTSDFFHKRQQPHYYYNIELSTEENYMIKQDHQKEEVQNLFFGKYADLREYQIDYTYHSIYTKERQTLQDNIINKFLHNNSTIIIDPISNKTCTKPSTSTIRTASSVSGEDLSSGSSSLSNNTNTNNGGGGPWIVFTAGAMGAGKSYTIKKLSKNDKFPLQSFIKVDPDDVRHELPEFTLYLEHGDPLKAGELTRKESGYICEILILAALREGKNVLVDGTLRDHVWYTSYFDKLRSISSSTTSSSTRRTTTTSTTGHEDNDQNRHHIIDDSSGRRHHFHHHHLSPKSNNNKNKNKSTPTSDDINNNTNNIKIGILHVTAPKHLIYQRAYERSKITGRIVPKHTLDMAIKQVPVSIEILKNNVDFFVELHNNGIGIDNDNIDNGGNEKEEEETTDNDGIILSKPKSMTWTKFKNNWIQSCA